jgi:hypothetical protein
MFGSKHYVPILRSKMAERLALRNLLPSDRKRITPLIELTPASFKGRKRGEIREEPDPVRVLDQEAKNLLEACGYLPFFLDLRLIDRQISAPGGKTHALEYLASLARDYRLLAVPVTGLSRSVEYQSSVSRVVGDDGRGVCLRVTLSEVLRSTFQGEIQDVLKKIGVRAKSVHLVVDYETSDPTELDPRSVLAKIPRLNEWQTLSIASGAFPPDLQEFEPGNRRIPRKDWLAWMGTLQKSGSRARKPSFADYTIQYGLYREPPDFCNPSVSIRYTLENDWLIMRGEATRGRNGETSEDRPGREQWNAQAQLLCDDKELFYGPKFSWGDEFIYQRSLNAKKGSFEIWLRAGINHHMTVVSRQIANLDAA